MRKEETKQPISKTVFFYDDDQEFSNKDSGINGTFTSTSGLLDVRMSFNKGEYLLFLNNTDTNTIIVLKQSQNTEELPLQSDRWIKKQITSDEDIPEECRKYCHYDEQNQTLVVRLTIPFDYALDYGTLPWCYGTYLQFMTGHRWRFLDRVTGG